MLIAEVNPQAALLPKSKLRSIYAEAFSVYENVGVFCKALGSVSGQSSASIRYVADVL